MRSDAATSNNTSISVLSDTGLYVGGDSDGRIFVTGTDVYVSNQTQDGDTIFQVNDGGVTTTALTLDGATANAVIAKTLSINAGSAATALINGGTSGTGNIGASGQGWNTVFAKSTSAQYADMAERFHADAEYTSGTIVELGGVNEITLCVEELSATVFGVVSTQPAYLMNSIAGTNATHPPIAMSGRVPVNVMGFITKGDRLVSAGNGVARSANLDEITAFNVIGRALESKTDEGIGSVEAIVKIA